MNWMDNDSLITELGEHICKTSFSMKKGKIGEAITF
jgi:hypothetical protein